MIPALGPWGKSKSMGNGLVMEGQGRKGMSRGGTAGFEGSATTLCDTIKADTWYYGRGQADKTCKTE